MTRLMLKIKTQKHDYANVTWSVENDLVMSVKPCVYKIFTPVKGTLFSEKVGKENTLLKKASDVARTFYQHDIKKRIITLFSSLDLL